MGACRGGQGWSLHPARDLLAGVPLAGGGCLLLRHSQRLPPCPHSLRSLREVWGGGVAGGIDPGADKTWTPSGDHHAIATRQPGSGKSSSSKRRSPGMPSKRPFRGGARSGGFWKGPRRETPPASVACISLTSPQISSLQNLRSLGSSHSTPPEKGRVVMRARRKRARRRWKRWNKLSLTWCGRP